VLRPTNRPLSLQRLVAGLSRRGRETGKLAFLSTRLLLSRKPIWIDYGRIRLPFHGDGDRQELYYHLYVKEWWDKELRLISPHLKPGAVVIDVGANIGFMSGIFSKLAGANGRVYSFEPSHSVYAKLLQVIKTNEYRNVVPYNLGCGSHDQSMTLHGALSSGNASLRSDAASENPQRKSEPVRIISLDEFLGPKLERLDFLKIDTEGFEDQVLLGAEQIIRRLMPIIYIEFSLEYADSSERAMNLLQRHGYAFDREVDLQKCRNGDNFFALPPNPGAAHLLGDRQVDFAS